MFTSFNRIVLVRGLLLTMYTYNGTVIRGRGDQRNIQYNMYNLCIPSSTVENLFGNCLYLCKEMASWPYFGFTYSLLKWDTWRWSKIAAVWYVFSARHKPRTCCSKELQTRIRVRKSWAKHVSNGSITGFWNKISCGTTNSHMRKLHPLCTKK